MVPSQWGQAANRSFEFIKEKLTSTSLLVLHDFKKVFEPKCNDSNIGISVVLIQENRPIAYLSEKLHRTALNYPIYNKELYSLIQALKVW